MVIKCKMCGGDMELNAEKAFGTCEYCGSTMTLPKLSDEQRLAAFNRGNHFRRLGEFDKALAVYERIVQEDDSDAEAHWCCALCRFGIEYVEDPATYEWLPTCHRASFDSFLEDVDYKAALEYSDGITRRQYMKDAAKIAEVQRGILATSQNTEPYDVFICYKETDESGRRTRDSLLAQDIYYQLTEQGRRVFFARITLEDVAGSQYEPYIFAALNSAKVMVVVGTKPEHLNAVWVKNEWSRFLAMMKKDHSKLLLPCYRDMDPYDLPEQLSVLQSYDMGKIGFIQDLIRGVGKVLDAEKKPAPTAAPTETVVVQQNSNVTALLKRGAMALEDGEWSKADGFFEEVLNQDAECAEAYLGKLMAELCVRMQVGLRDCKEPFDQNSNYQKTLRFADAKLKAELAAYIEHINARNEEARLLEIYTRAQNTIATAKTEQACKEAAKLFESIGDYKNSAALATASRDKAEVVRKDSILSKAKEDMARGALSNYRFALKQLESIPGWKDADESAELCRQRIKELEAKAEVERKEAERTARRNRKIAAVTLVLLLLAAGAYFGYSRILVPGNTYKEAEALLVAGEYDAAAAVFEGLGDYKDATLRVEEAKTAELDSQYNNAIALMDAGKYEEAISAFEALNGYKDSAEKSVQCAAAIPESENSAEENTAVERRSAVPKNTLLVSSKNVAAIKEDGTVVSTDYGYRVSDWADIVSIGGYGQLSPVHYMAGLRSDGTVEMIGGGLGIDPAYVESWTDIVSISCVPGITGIRADGTVVTSGGFPEVEDWTDIVDIKGARDRTVGLRKDGTVVATGRNEYGQNDVGDWTDIVAVCATGDRTVGLRKDGTVVAAGYNASRQCDVGDWTDIVDICANEYATLGLRSDGTVVFASDNVFFSELENWTDIVDIETGRDNTIGLRSDGTLLYISFASDYAYRFSAIDWTNIRLPNT